MGSEPNIHRPSLDSVVDIAPPVLGMITTGPADAGAWLVAVVENSFDAIISKTLDGIITSWNAGASALFGFSAAEAIGSPITILIPDDRRHEEDLILAKLRAGERISQFETVRRAKDGRLIAVELSISPVCDPQGRVIGASKIARDISERRELAERQVLLLREMNHRIKNLFSIVQGLIGVCRKTAQDADGLAADLTSRLISLDAAHSLILPGDHRLVNRRSVMLSDLLNAVLAPYVSSTVHVEGIDCLVGARALTSLALIFHELATNSVKYGALSALEGRLDIVSSHTAEGIDLIWFEHDLPTPENEPEGFGTALQRAALRGLGGRLERAWTPQGLEISIFLPFEALAR